jgi:translocation and assembly module TamB
VDKRIELRGNLKADQALFILPDESTPVLGSDVVVHSSTSRSDTASSALPDTAGVRILPDVAITLDLGNDFRVQGRGVNTRLAGTLALHTTLGATASPRLTGEVRAIAGTYRAYGQYLNIEEGVLRFTGPFDNPALDILAIRPNLSVRVGVQITGTALAPRVRLYANPELPDGEKLAWLVLGRSAAAGGAESAVLQQAALALLGGRNGGMSGGIAQSIGLDELSFRGSATASDGTTSAAAVTLGKRLSRDFYVAYERSLAGTLGTFYIFYDLSKRFTLRAQTGEQSAVDLIFTLPYD